MKLPVRYDTELCSIYDDNDDIIVYEMMSSHTDEIVKRINAYDDLNRSLKDIVEIVGSNFCSNKDTKLAYRNARELLERLK